MLLSLSNKIRRMQLLVLPERSTATPITQVWRGNTYPGLRGFSWFFFAKEIKSKPWSGDNESRKRRGESEKPLVTLASNLTFMQAFATRCRRFTASSWSLSRRKIMKNLWDQGREYAVIYYFERKRSLFKLMFQKQNQQFFKMRIN